MNYSSSQHDGRPHRFRCFEMIRSVWVPTGGALIASTSSSATLAVVGAVWASRVAGTDDASVLLTALVGAALLQATILYTLRCVEEELLEFSDDVRADRANGMLWVFSLPSVACCAALLALRAALLELVS